MQCRSPVKRRKARTMARFRNISSGACIDSTKALQAIELKQLPKKTRLDVCSDAGVAPKAHIDRQTITQLKNELSASDHAMKKATRLLKEKGVTFDSQRSVKEYQDTLIGDHLEIEMYELEKKEGDDIFIEETPVVQVKNLTDFVHEILGRLEAAGKLIDFPDGDLSNAIGVKLGGDHGGGSFKLSLSVVNVEKPNSKDNTYMFCMFEGRDSRYNLEQVMTHYWDQIKELRRSTFRNKPILVVLCGDYDFMCKNYGTSGARGTYPCIWCHVKNDQLREDMYSTQTTVRTLHSLRQDHQKFTDELEEDREKAAQCHNVVNSVIWKVGIGRTCPPYLHILMGIVKKHHEMLINHCHDIDVALALEQDPANDTPYIGHFRKWIFLVEKIEEIKANLPVQTRRRREGMRRVKTLTKRAQQLDKEIKKARKKMRKTGQVAASIEEELQNNGIQVQAYHSGSFVGNHCHKYLQTPVYTAVCDRVVAETAEVTDTDTILGAALETSCRFKTLFELYAKVHNIVSHTTVQMQDGSCNDGQREIDEYMDFFRETFSEESVIPKQHILQAHIPAFMTRNNVGMAMFGEQGLEQLHSTIKRMMKSAWGIRNEGQRLLFVMKRHLLSLAAYHTT